MNAPIIEAEGLVKRFGKVEALSGLDLVAQGGEVSAPSRSGASSAWPASTRRSSQP